MIYLQEINGEPLDNDIRLLAEFFDGCNLNYQKINFETIKLLNHNIKSLFVGSVEFMREAFYYQAGFLEPKSIQENPFRIEEVMESWVFKEAIKSGETWFVKPYGPHTMKKFDGFVCNQLTISFMGNYNGKVIRSKPFEQDILSEWRAFIHYGKIVDIRNYSGDPTVFPDLNFVESAITHFPDVGNQPKAFCVDLAILEDGSNTLIEYTDMWALGAYGCDIRTYFTLLKTRYFEIITEK